MLDYPTLKAVHVTCVAVSFVLFFLRGAWMIGGSTMLQHRWVRVLPHVNDTVLLAAAIALALMLRQYPFVHGWLTAKVLALAAYILLGRAAPARATLESLATDLSTNVITGFPHARYFSADDAPITSTPVEGTDTKVESYNSILLVTLRGASFSCQSSP